MLKGVWIHPVTIPKSLPLNEVYLFMHGPMNHLMSYFVSRLPFSQGGETKVLVFVVVVVVVVYLAKVLSLREYTCFLPMHYNNSNVARPRRFRNSPTPYVTSSAITAAIPKGFANICKINFTQWKWQRYKLIKIFIFSPNMAWIQIKSWLGHMSFRLSPPNLSGFPPTSTVRDESRRLEKTPFALT